MRTIAEALADCQVAWAPYEENWQGRAGWNIHHERALELLTEPPSARITYIMVSKAAIERITRLDNFRPFPRPFSEKIQRLRDESSRLWGESSRLRDEAKRLWGESYRLRDEAKRLRDESSRLWGESYRLRDESSRLWDESSRLWGESSRLWDEYAASAEGQAAHLTDVPGHTWNGKSIFS
jgi:hypothetical protein